MGWNSFSQGHWSQGHQLNKSVDDFTKRALTSTEAVSRIKCHHLKNDIRVNAG
jgi:hypothetical protein